MKKILKTTLIVCIIIAMTILVNSTKAIEELDTTINLECNDELEAGKIITINVNISDLKKNIDTIIAMLEYDKTIFEEITEENIEPVNKWNYPTYNMENGMIYIEKTRGTTTDETAMNINLKVKDNIDKKSTVIRLNELELAGFGEDLKSNKFAEVKIGKEDSGEEDLRKSLYLSSEIYKIGDNDIKNYEDGDKYLSRVEKETTLDVYIENLHTNGDIKVVKEDGKTELKDNELVGTGMTLIVTKDEETIELKIAVMGDLSGDGKVTAQDLSTLNQAILKTLPTPLENEYKIAADLDENDKLTATDLSTILKMI